MTSSILDGNEYCYIHNKPYGVLKNICGGCYTEKLEQENQKLKELVKEAIADLERHKKALDHCKGYLFMLMSDEEQARARKEIEAILNKKSHE